ncbi:MAG: mechanosensitive ion channel family protein, partial [Holophagales bacterium]|nr:mechanosensitive ion channel family protein [Holophagales bacterium]
AAVAITVLNVFGVPATSFAAILGALTLAIGLSMQGALGNIASGVMIMIFRPYKLGDFITLDSGERGLVTHVGIRSTRLLTRDDTEITLPNAVIANAKILNESGGRWEKERIRIKVGVAYGTDVDKVCELLKEVATHHEEICTDPKPRVRMRAFGNSSLDFELLCWIDQPVLRGKLTHEMLMDVYKTFDRENVEIPFPQNDVWVRRLPEPESPDR